MSTIHLVIQSAVYRHAIVGAFITLDEAKAIADTYAAADDHHDFEVIECVVGVASPLLENNRNADTWRVVYTAEHAVKDRAHG